MNFKLTSAMLALGMTAATTTNALWVPDNEYFLEKRQVASTKTSAEGKYRIQ
jgi:hypothetical protein